MPHRWQDYLLTDGHQDITSDDLAASLKPGVSLMLITELVPGGGAQKPLKERISFSPHPKTLTMAGDYEYFAAQVGWAAESRECHLLLWSRMHL